MQGLGLARQVMCVTHLPQVAAFADTRIFHRQAQRQKAVHTDAERLAATARVENLRECLPAARSPRRHALTLELFEQAGAAAPDSSLPVPTRSEESAVASFRREARNLLFKLPKLERHSIVAIAEPGGFAIIEHVAVMTSRSAQDIRYADRPLTSSRIPAPCTWDRRNSASPCRCRIWCATRTAVARTRRKRTCPCVFRC